jgi:hypothetical protein
LRKFLLKIVVIWHAYMSKYFLVKTQRMAERGIEVPSEVLKPPTRERVSATATLGSMYNLLQYNLQKMSCCS